MHWELHIHTIIYKTDNNDLLYGMGNYIQYLIITYNEKNLKEYVYITKSLAVHLKLIKLCKSTTLQ